MQLSKDKTVLEIGVGTGRLAVRTAPLCKGFYGIDISTEMVVGAEGDTLESIKETAKFVNNSHIVVPRFYILTPIPGTKFFDDMMEQDRIYNHDIYSYNKARS